MAGGGGGGGGGGGRGVHLARADERSGAEHDLRGVGGAVMRRADSDGERRLRRLSSGL